MPLPYPAVRLQGSACRAFFKHANLMAEQKAGLLGLCDFIFFFLKLLWVLALFFPFCFVTVKSHSLVEFQGKSGVKTGSL